MEAEIMQLEGDSVGGLTAATFRNRRTDEARRYVLHHLFLFIGADPNTGWLGGCVDLDDKGFVRTSTSGSLATSRSHIFVASNVRTGLTKRVAAAVGDGAAVVAQIHLALAEDVYVSK